MRVVHKALTFDDVLLVPAHSPVVPRDVRLADPPHPHHHAEHPAAVGRHGHGDRSAPRDRDRAGRRHRHRPQEHDAAAQAAEVAKVKRFESGVVKDPITIPPTMSVREVLALTQQHRISGLPVVDGQRVVGIVTNRDLRFETNLDQPVANIMTPRDKLVTVPEGTELETRQGADAPAPPRARAGRQRRLGAARPHHRQGHPEVDRASRTRARTSSGACASARRSAPARDTEERVEALVGSRRRRDRRRHRRTATRRACSTASRGSRSAIPKRAGHRRQRRHRRAARKALADHGADGVKVGIGPGSICTTRIVAGVGVPQITAIQNVARRRSRTATCRCIADGGIRYSGDIAKAIAAGASSRDARQPVRRHRGSRPARSSSTRAARTRAIAAWARSARCSRAARDRYFQDAEGEGAAEKLVPEGIEGRVPYKGALVAVDPPADGRLARRMGYCGCRDDRGAAHARRVRRDHLGGHARVARARRADHRRKRPTTGSD